MSAMHQEAMRTSAEVDGHATRLLQFARALVTRPLPQGLALQAKRRLLDNIGCGLFGAGQPWSRLMRAEIASDGASGSCTVLGEHTASAAPQAALANGTAIHGFELDDLIAAAIVHPGTVVVPAVLATAEAVEASGQAMLAALVVGYEATARISLALGTEPSQRGFHKTAVVGPVAAAIACAALRGASLAQLQSAVGLACSMASGIKAFAGGGGGGMVKRMHAGRAAEAGVRAAQLACRGFTGPAAALDGHLGLLEVFAGTTARPDQLSAGLHEQWYVEQVWMKVYPLCGWIQGVAQLLHELRGPQPLAAAQVRRIVVGTSAFAVRHNGNRSPRDEMEAQYSIPYCAALGTMGDAADPAAFTLDALAEPAWRSVAERVDLHVDEESEAAYPDRFGTRVALHLADGRCHAGFTLDPHGTAGDPLSDAELRAKFERLAALAPRAVDAAAIVRCIERLESADDMRELTRLLRA